jgi:hypothetical protein
MTDTLTSAPMLAKIRKLLAKAADPAATPDEAETYTAKAEALMATYGIDRALMALADPSLDVVGDLVVVLDRPFAADKADLLSAVALTLGCEGVRRTRWPDGVKELSLHLFGHRSDLQRAEMLFTSLLVQAVHGLARTPVPAEEHVAAFRRSWLAGFTHAVRTRLTLAERTAAHRGEADFAARGTTSTLVLADRRVEVAQARAEAYPHLRAASPRALSGSGELDGWDAGQRADLGGARLRGGRPVLGR